MNKLRTHFVHNELLQPQNPIKVALIGVGGTGSHVLTALAKIDFTANKLQHPGLHVTAFDDDVVSEFNIPKQMFANADIGLPKVSVLISRINRFFGTTWKGIPERCLADAIGDFDVVITCVDNVASRMEIAKFLHLKRNFNLKYWLDFGNAQSTGQVLLSTVGKVPQPKSKAFNAIAKLPDLFEEFGDLVQQSEDNDLSPSCSMEEALNAQELFINPCLANLGTSLLWSMLRKGCTSVRGLFLNLDTFVAQPIPV